MAYEHIKLSDYMLFKSYDDIKPSDKYVGFTWRINNRPYIGQVAKAFRIVGIDYKLTNCLSKHKEITNFHYEEIQFVVDDDD